MSPAPAPILRLDGQRASVGEEGWRTARVEENAVVAWPPPSCPYECDETSKPFARVDRVKREGFEGTRQFDRFDCCVMRDAISRSGVAGDDFHICVIEHGIRAMGPNPVRLEGEAARGKIGFIVREFPRMPGPSG